MLKAPSLMRMRMLEGPMPSRADDLKEALHSYNQFLLALKIESASNVFGALVVVVAFYFFSHRLDLRPWFAASALLYVLGAVTAAAAYLLVARARDRLGSDQGSTAAAPIGPAEERTRTTAAILAFVSGILFGFGSSLPILGWFLGWLWS
jgi:hypothetical protein